MSKHSKEETPEAATEGAQAQDAPASSGDGLARAGVPGKPHDLELKTDPQRVKQAMRPELLNLVLSLVFWLIIMLIWVAVPISDNFTLGVIEFLAILMPIYIIFSPLPAYLSKSKLCKKQKLTISYDQRGNCWLYFYGKGYGGKTGDIYNEYRNGVPAVKNISHYEEKNNVIKVYGHFMVDKKKGKDEDADVSTKVIGGFEIQRIFENEQELLAALNKMQHR